MYFWSCVLRIKKYYVIQPVPSKLDQSITPGEFNPPPFPNIATNLKHRNHSHVFGRVDWVISELHLPGGMLCGTLQKACSYVDDQRLGEFKPLPHTNSDHVFV